MKSPAITLSVVSHGQGPICALLLADLRRLAPPQVTQLILTLNLPEALPALHDLPFAVEILRNERPRGFAENHNRAFARITTDFFAVMNPDLRLDGDPFPALLDSLKDPAVGLAAPLVLEADGTVADFARALVSPWQVLRRRFARTAQVTLPDQPEWIAGMFLAFRREVYASVGGFDARFRLYCEDVDLCARLRLRGLRLVIVRSARVTHLAQRASRRSPVRLALHLSSLFKLWTSQVYSDYRSLLREAARKTP